MRVDSANPATHLFYIHSNVALVCALLIIAHEKLSPERCICILARGMSADGVGFRTSVLPVELHESRFYPKRRFWRNWPRVVKLDRYLDQLCDGNDYVVYLPHTRTILCRLLASHRLCRGYRFYEEGTDAYHSNQTLSVTTRRRRSPALFQRLLHFLNYGGRTNRFREHYDTGCQAVYALSEAAFPDFREKVLLSVRDLAQDYPFVRSGSGLDDTLLLIPDASVEEGHTSVAAYVGGIERGLRGLLSGEAVAARRIAVKFHPAQDRSVRKAIESLLSGLVGSTGYEVLPSSSVIELMLLSSRHVRVVTSVSSVGLYAHLAGHPVFSIASCVTELDPAYGALVERLPRLYRDALVRL